MHSLKKVLIVVLLFAAGIRLYAVSAYPYPVEVQQPNGEIIKIQLHGDEFFHYITAEDGSVVMQGDKGYYVYANISEDGSLTPSTVSVTNQSLKSSFLNVVRADSEEFKEKIVRPASKRVREKRQEAHGREPFALRNARGGAADDDRYLVILVEFADVKFKKTAADFSAMLNQTGYDANGATGSVKDYYVDNSMGKFEPQFDVYGPVTLPNSMTYYGANDANGDDIRAKQMVIDACRALDSQIDFSAYSTIEENIVDNVYVFYAGYSEASGGGSNTIWPHKYTVSDLNTFLDGVKLADYACSSELRGSQGANMSGIGTFTHEFGHVLALPDMYDADGALNGQGVGLGSWSVMASGNYLNYERTPPFLNSAERFWMKVYHGEGKFDWGMLYLLSLGNNNVDTPYSISPISNTENYGFASDDWDYYIFEARKRQNWDAYLPAEGLFVYHVDMTWNTDKNIVQLEEIPIRSVDLWAIGYANIIGDHQCLDLLRANGAQTPLEATPFPGSQNITAISGDRLKLWDGKPLGVELKNITRNELDGSVSFLLSKYNPSSLPENSLSELPDFYVQDKRIYATVIVDQAQIDVYDIEGRLCVSSLVGIGESVVVSQPGIYVVRLKEGARTIQSKVVVY